MLLFGVQRAASCVQNQGQACCMVIQALGGPTTPRCLSLQLRATHPSCPIDVVDRQARKHRGLSRPEQLRKVVSQRAAEAPSLRHEYAVSRVRSGSDGTIGGHSSVGQLEGLPAQMDVDRCSMQFDWHIQPHRLTINGGVDATPLGVGAYGVVGPPAYRFHLDVKSTGFMATSLFGAQASAVVAALPRSSM